MRRSNSDEISEFVDDHLDELVREYIELTDEDKPQHQWTAWEWNNFYTWAYDTIQDRFEADNQGDDNE